MITPVLKLRHCAHLPAKVEFLQWNSDHILAPLTDLSAALLDSATGQFPPVLTSFTLNISLLSQEGLHYVQNILQRSILRHLLICCIAFDPDLTDFVRRILLSIQWHILQSLVLYGPAVNKWIQLLATLRSNDAATDISLFDFQLQCIRIQGLDKKQYMSFPLKCAICPWSGVLESVDGPRSRECEHAGPERLGTASRKPSLLKKLQGQDAGSKESHSFLCT